jgi:hypothetical protein
VKFNSDRRGISPDIFTQLYLKYLLSSDVGCVVPEGNASWVLPHGHLVMRFAAQKHILRWNLLELFPDRELDATITPIGEAPVGSQQAEWRLDPHPGPDAQATAWTTPIVTRLA